MTFKDIVIEHAKWKIHLRTTIEKGVPTIPSMNFATPEYWPLGSWLKHNEPSLGHLKDFRNFKREYEAFHLCVADMLLCLENGHHGKARELAQSEMFTLIASSTSEALVKLQRHLETQ